MFKSVKSFAQKVTIASTLVVSTVVPTIMATPVHAQTAPTTTAYSSISVTVDNVSFKDLYDFTTDLHNDSSWFPNVQETVQTKDADKPNSKTGIEYNQISFFNTIELDTHVVVKGDVNSHLFYIEGTGPIATYNALYTFHPASHGGGTFTLTTKFTSQGLTEPILTYLLNFAMQNII